jgi:hypothetical protein
MSESKVVIRINLGKEKPLNAEIERQTRTVWHIQRIVGVSAILLLLCIILVIWLFSVKTPETAEAVKPQNSEFQSVDKSISKPIKPEYISTETKSSIASIDHTLGNADQLQHYPPSAIIFDKKVIRASLNFLIKDNEPFEQVNSPVRVFEDKTIELFYFTEIKSLKGKSLYHHWTKNGKQVYKKPFEVRENRVKLISSKKLYFYDKGNWQIQLVDQKGKVFSEVNFNVD